MNRQKHRQKLSSPGLRRERRRPPAELWWAAIPVVLVGLALFIVMRADGARPRATPTRPGVEHVHGLGIDPADGVLYAATHTGLFRMTDGDTAKRIADRYQDTMGFTIVGPGHFLGSGHPALEDHRLRRPGTPPLLGLIESTDAGETWEPLSLLGEADFHALVAAHDRVYGFDATNGRFMVSEDKRSWETRSELALNSFAVDPQDPDRILATTGNGLVSSGDGGRVWQANEGPDLVFLDWDPSTGLWGLGPGGEVFNDPAASGDWTRTADLDGRAEALLVDGSEIYAAVMSKGGTEIRSSRDGGKTWRVRYRDP